MGWAVKDCRDKIADPKLSNRLLLEQMVCLEKDVSNDYMRERYDLLTLCRTLQNANVVMFDSDAIFHFCESNT